VRDQLADTAVIELTIGDTDLVAWHRPGQASDLDDTRVSGGRDIGTVGVFLPEAGGQRLTFAPVEGGFRHQQTGTTWNVLGHATDGPLDGRAAHPLPAGGHILARLGRVPARHHHRSLTGGRLTR
jgi:hypothetical protein